MWEKGGEEGEKGGCAVGMKPRFVLSKRGNSIFISLLISDLINNRCKNTTRNYPR